MSEPKPTSHDEAPPATAESASFQALPHPPWPGSFPISEDYGRDVPESWLREVSPVVLALLLADRSTGRNIRWCTDDYTAHGEGFGFADEIAADCICGADHVIRPRVDKRLEEQKARVTAKGEVFTPAWVCNAQNNLLDQSWFGIGKRPIFNTEDGRTWIPTDNRTLDRCFEARKLKPADYITLVRLEVACGEAPYLSSRYDTATGDPIPVSRRIGLLDRKLRVISLKARDRNQWVRSARVALQSLYAFDWQGDNVMLARENLLFATLEAFAARWPDTSGLALSVVESFASVISWNVFQMDGVKFVIPLSCHDEALPINRQPELALDADSPAGSAPPEKPARRPCLGCKTGDHRLHNGVRPLVVDWSKSPFEARAVPFFTLFPTP